MTLLSYSTRHRLDSLDLPAEHVGTDALIPVERMALAQALDSMLSGHPMTAGEWARMDANETERIAREEVTK